MKLLEEFEEIYQQSLIDIPFPQTLFDTLNALKPSEVVIYVHRYCHPESDCYKKIEALANDEMHESPEAYVCFALITCDITRLKKGVIGNLCSYLITQYPESSFNETLRWMYTLLHVLDNKIILNQCLQSINKTVPCYMNYSGLDFSFLELIENIHFLNSTCRNTSFKFLKMIDCNFMGANLTAAYMRKVIVEECHFLNAICDKTRFLKNKDLDDFEKGMASADALYQFLAHSKGRDTLKQAMQENLLTILQEINDIDLKRNISSALFERPLFAEHRSIISSYTNSMLSLFKRNAIKTNGQKILISKDLMHENDISNFINVVHSEDDQSNLIIEQNVYDDEESDFDAYYIYNLLHNPDDKLLTGDNIVGGGPFNGEGNDMQELQEAEVLFKTLNALKLNDVITYIQKNCTPISFCYREIDRTKLQQPLAYVCYMLITKNILELSTEGMEWACNYLKETHPKSSFNTSLAWIYTVNRISQNALMLGQILKSINKEVPCYMNYSGVDFTILEIIENVCFANGNCWGTSFDGLMLYDCDFFNTGLNDAEFRIKGGERCVFSNVACANTRFIYSLDTVLNDLTRLHALLVNSTGRKSIKSAIIEDIMNKLANMADSQRKKEIIVNLNKHPLFTEHRNSVSSGLNSMFSMNQEGNVIKTKGQKTLLQQYPYTNLSHSNDEGLYYESVNPLDSILGEQDIEDAVRAVRTGCLQQ